MAPSTLPPDTLLSGAAPVSSAATAVTDEATAAVAIGSISLSDSGPPQCRRIQVSREKRPLNFFVTLSKKFLQTDDVIELSGLGLAVTTVVTIAEILKTAGLVVLEHIETSLVEPHPDGHSSAPKAKIQIWIRKTPEFDARLPAAGTQATGNHSRSRNHDKSTASDPTTSVTSVGVDSSVPTDILTTADAGNTNPPAPDELPLPLRSPTADRPSVPADAA